MREKLVLAGLAGQTIGHYQVLELVGGGGMSTVYKAFDLLEKEEVAFKVLSPALAEQGSFSERFTREPADGQNSCSDRSRSKNALRAAVPTDSVIRSVLFVEWSRIMSTLCVCFL